MRDEERLKRIELLLKELEDFSSKGAAIVVEGRKDRRALRDLGIQGKIIFASHFPLFQLSEQIANDSREIIVMTDWDQEGEMLAKKISRYLTAFGRSPNLIFRLRLGAMVRKEVKEVENLAGYIARLRVECRVEDQFQSPQNIKPLTSNTVSLIKS